MMLPLWHLLPRNRRGDVNWLVVTLVILGFLLIFWFLWFAKSDGSADALLGRLKEALGV